MLSFTTTSASKSMSLASQNSHKYGVVLNCAVKAAFPTSTAAASNVLLQAASVSSKSSSSSSPRLIQQDYKWQHKQPTHESEKIKRNFSSLNSETPYQLCFLRHGQSTWNRENIFIGWSDTPLTDDGVLEARAAGQMLAKSNIRFDEVHTSMLRRCIRTTNIALMELGQEYIPVHKHWRLNERSYGNLVGQNKKEAVKKFGKDQVKRWRRSYDEPPPEMVDEHPFHPRKDPRYRMITDQIPKAESLKDTLARSRVYWEEVLAPALQDGKTLLVVGHENNLRSLIMNLEEIPKEDIIELNLPRAIPLVYRLDLETLKPLDRPDGKLDEATGMLRGEWVGGDNAVSSILDRDEKQVYDTSIQRNLEYDESSQKWNKWMDVVSDKANRKAKESVAENNSRPVTKNSLKIKRGLYGFRLLELLHDKTETRSVNGLLK